MPIASDQVVAFYEQELGRDGYVAREKKKTLKTGASIEFERDAEWISIVATDDVPAKGAPEGVEVAARVRISEALSLGAAYTFLEATDPSGEREPRRPSHSGRAPSRR